MNLRRLFNTTGTKNRSFFSAGHLKQPAQKIDIFHVGHLRRSAQIIRPAWETENLERAAWDHRFTGPKYLGRSHGQPQATEKMFLLSMRAALYSNPLSLFLEQLDLSPLQTLSLHTTRSREAMACSSSTAMVCSSLSLLLLLHY
jgi:hypothetical protein